MSFIQLFIWVLSLLLLEAMWDGNDFIYHKTAKQIYGYTSHIMQLLLFASIFMFGMKIGYLCGFGTGHFNYTALLYVLLGYATLRVSIFNVVYNKFVGNPAMFIGTSNLYDRLLNLIIRLLQKCGLTDIRYFNMVYGNILVLSFFFACWFINDAINNL
jgi:hypothetical protein